MTPEQDKQLCTVRPVYWLFYHSDVDSFCSKVLLWRGLACRLGRWRCADHFAVHHLFHNGYHFACSWGFGCAWGTAEIENEEQLN